jgi:hypothetical protein
MIYSEKQEYGYQAKIQPIDALPDQERIVALRL